MSLQVALRIRRVSLDDAKRQLTEAIGREDDAKNVLDAAERAIHEQTEAAADPASNDAAVEALSRWLVTGRAAVTAARSAYDLAQSEVARLRAVLIAVRVSVASVESVITERRQRDRLTKAKAMERELRDHPGRPRQE